jgi:hypothetical protein
MKKLTNLQHEAHKLRLTPEEKATMRAHIFGAPSPMHVTRSPYVFVSFSSYWSRSFAAVMLFVLVGAGTASAAQGALPGDLLYPVKISINESVEVALASGPGKKAEVQARLAERRVEEAETLASEGRLDEQKAQLIAEKIEKHTAEATALAEADEGDDAAASVKIKETLAASLTAHGEVLAKIGSGSKDGPTKEQSGSLAARVVARAQTGDSRSGNARSGVAIAPTAKVAGQEQATTQTMTLSVASDTGGPTEPSAQMVASLQEKASQTLSETKKLFEDTKDKLDATTTAQISDKFSAAAEAMSKGSLLVTSAPGEAAAHFTEALRISMRLQALLRAERKFDNGIIRGLLFNVQIEQSNSGPGGGAFEVETEHGSEGESSR